MTRSITPPPALSRAAAADRDSAARALRDNGLRVTRPRLASLIWLAGHPHATVEQLASAVRRELGSLSTQGVYDLLAAFRETGLVRCFEPSGHPARYECRTGDNHHHLVCRGCGHIEDVDCAVGRRPCLTPLDNRGFDVDEAEVVYWGLCATCKTRSGP